MHQAAAFEPHFDHGEALDALSRLLEVVGSRAPLRAQLRDLALYVERLSGDIRCSVHLYNRSTKTLHTGAAPHLPETYNAAIDGVEIGEGVGSCGTAATRRAMVVVADIQSSPLWHDYRDLARAHDLAACWSVPVIYGQGELLGTFAMYYSKPREPSAAELDVLRIAGPLAAVVIQRHRDAQMLKQSEERFGAVFEHASIGMALVSPEGKWLRVNPAICRIVGYTADELLQIDFQAITHPDDLMIDLNHVREMLAGTRHSYQLEKRYLHKMGHTVWVLLSVSLVRDECGIPLYFISQTQDITERRRLEQSLSEFMSSRQRQLGRDLHDGLAQELTGLSLLASAFATKAERAGSQLAGDARALARIATTALATCRDIVQGVSPLTESNGGLEESLRQLTDRATAFSGCVVNFRSAGVLPPSMNWYTRSQLYVIAQEALNNVLANPQTGRVDLSLQVEPCCVRLTVAQHCEEGFVHDVAHNNLGMATMSLRAAAINARISMSQRPTGGTELTCECLHDAQMSVSELPVARRPRAAARHAR